MIYLTDNFNQSNIHFIEDIMTAGVDIKVISKSELEVGNAKVYFLPMIFSNQMVAVPREKSPVFALNIQVPEFWEIHMDYHQGLMLDKDIQRGVIHYFEAGLCMTKMVEWWDTTGKVLKKDYYHESGWRYKQELFNEEEQVISIHYFSPENQLLMVEDVDKQIYTVFDKDRTYFYNEKQLWITCVENLRKNQEPLVVGDVKIAEYLQEEPIIACYTDKTPLEQNDIQLWLSLVDKLYIYHYSVYHTIPRLENIHHLSPLYRLRSNVSKHRALIVTHTQEVERIEELVDALPILEFHIAAVTAMGGEIVGLRSKRKCPLISRNITTAI